MDFLNANSRGVAMSVVVKDDGSRGRPGWCYDAVQIPISHGELTNFLSNRTKLLKVQ